MRHANKVLGILVLCIPLVYIAAYLSLVRNTNDVGAYTSWEYSADPYNWSCAPHYGIESRLLEWFFLPANAIDRQIRPKYWMPGDVLWDENT